MRLRDTAAEASGMPAALCGKSRSQMLGFRKFCPSAVAPNGRFA